MKRSPDALAKKIFRRGGNQQLVLIDGGKGQLDAAFRLSDKTGYNQLPFIGLAKREEQIVIQKKRSTLLLIKMCYINWAGSLRKVKILYWLICRTVLIL